MLAASRFRSARPGFGTSAARATSGCGGALAGNPAVVSVNGASLLTAVVEAHAAVRDACAARGDVVFGTQGGSSLPPVSCNADIPPLPLVLEVRALPALTEP